MIMEIVDLSNPQKGLRDALLPHFEPFHFLITWALAKAALIISFKNFSFEFTTGLADTRTPAFSLP